MKVERCEEPDQKEWKSVCTMELAEFEGRMQRERVSVSSNGLAATSIRVKVMSGWEDFTLVHELQVDGDNE